MAAGSWPELQEKKASAIKLKNQISLSSKAQKLEEIVVKVVDIEIIGSKVG